jgi:hypothetical protein
MSWANQGGGWLVRAWICARYMIGEVSVPRGMIFIDLSCGCN